MKLRIATDKVSTIILISSVCFVAPPTVGQITDETSEEYRALIEAIEERDRGRATNPSPPPLPPYDPNEPDVAKRRRFVSELHRHRLGFCFKNLENSRNPADADIPDDAKAHLLEQCTTMLADQMKPANPDAVRWYGRWNNYLTPDAAGNTLRLDLIVAEWSIGDFVLRASQPPNSERYMSFGFRFPKRPSVWFRRPSPSLSEKELTRWQSVPKTQVRQLLVEVFGTPYDSDEDFRLRGHVEACAGVDVYTGKIRRMPGSSPLQDAQEGHEDFPEAWQRPYRILMTDSDPQYLCVGFDLGEKANDETP